MNTYSHDYFAAQNSDDADAQRNDARDSLLLVANLRLAHGAEPVQVRVRNLSAGGLMADLATPVDVGAAAEVEVRGVGWIPGRIAWVAAGRVGVAFDVPIDPQAARKPVGATAKAKAKPIRPLF